MTELRYNAYVVLAWNLLTIAVVFGGGTALGAYGVGLLLRAVG